MVETLLQGLLLGSLYALFALGLSLMFGVMRLTNVAHGDLIVLGAFAAIATANTPITKAECVEIEHLLLSARPLIALFVR